MLVAPLLPWERLSFDNQGPGWKMRLKYAVCSLLCCQDHKLGERNTSSCAYPTRLKSLNSKSLWARLLSSKAWWRILKSPRSISFLRWLVVDCDHKGIHIRCVSSVEEPVILRDIERSDMIPLRALRLQCWRWREWFYAPGLHIMKALH